MKNGTKLLCVLLSLIMALSVFTVLPVGVSAADIEITPAGATSGTTGDCTWYISGTKLIISGSGRMGSYDNDNYAPWHDYYDSGRDSGITELVIENGVTIVSKFAFCGCYDLEKVTIGNSVTGIGISAFNGCEKLTSVTLPASVTVIANNAFSYCGSLSSVTILGSVTSIGAFAFYNCTNLSNINLPDSVTSIGNSAFDGCSSLSDIHIPESLSFIDYSTFSGCSNLTSVVIPDSVSMIDSAAFYGCTKLESITLPESPTEIRNHVFFNCPRLKSVTIPASVRYINEKAFGYYEDKDFGTDMKVDGFTIYGYEGGYDEWGNYRESAAQLYAEENGFAFVSLGSGDQPPVADPSEPDDPTPGDGMIYFDAASAGWEDANAVMFDIYDLNDQRLPARTMPDDLRGTKGQDGIWSFNARKRGVQDGQLYYIIFWNDDTGAHTAQLLLDSSCYGDKAVCDGSMASELYVDYRPYYSTSGASSSGSSSASSSGSSFGTPWFSYPDYVSYPAVSWNNQHSFSLNGTIGVLTWTIENGVLTISGNGPLENDDKIKKIWDKLKFTKAVIGDGVTSIGDRVFDGCYSLESVTIGNAVTSIGELAFKDCKNLESVSIGGSVKSIGPFAFYRCVGLKTAVIGNSVMSIGNSAFYQCSDLTSVTIGNSVTKIDKYTFEDCDNLKNVTLGNSIYGIAAGAFYDCDNLESIILPDSVQIIADKAFSDCISLSSVNIPETVTDIGEKAFYNCPSLKNVTVPDSATNIDTKAFGYYYNNEFGITLRVPGFRLYGSVNSESQRYAKAFGFKFERAIAMTGDADGDLMITVMDVTEVQRSLSSLSTTSDEDITRYADVDHNNVLEVIDATYILRYVGEKEIPYDIGQIQD